MKHPNRTHYQHVLQQLKFLSFLVSGEETELSFDLRFGKDVRSHTGEAQNLLLQIGMWSQVIITLLMYEMDIGDF